MENSIEKDIHLLESYAGMTHKMNDNQGRPKLDQAIEHILSDYKRVLKENEILKEEKEQAWEEWNNLEQGSYETEQKLKQQIKELQKENEKLRKQLNEENKRCMMLAIEKQDYFEKYRYNLQQNESLTKEFSNVIPVQKVKDKIEELDKRIDFLNTELTKCYIEREKLGTETDIDNNETYIFYMEEEKNFREKQEEVLQELLREE